MCITEVFHQRPQISSLVSLYVWLLLIMMLIKRAILIIALTSSWSVQVSCLWFHLTLIAVNYLNINYKDKVQSHQSMPYSCLSENKHCPFGGLFFLSLICLPCVMVAYQHLSSDRSAFQRKTDETFKRSCVFESMVYTKFISYAKSCMFSP